MIDAIEVLGDFSAKKPARNRVVWIAAQPRCVTGLIDIDKNGASVRAVEGTDGFANFKRHEPSIVA
jgi:hypothetical protein